MRFPAKKAKYYVGVLDPLKVSSISKEMRKQARQMYYEHCHSSNSELTLSHASYFGNDQNLLQLEKFVFFLNIKINEKISFYLPLAC